MPPCEIPDQLSMSAFARSRYGSYEDSPYGNGSYGSSSYGNSVEPIPRPSTPSTYPPLPTQSIRTALILDRFSLNCHIIYCTNDSLLSTNAILGRSFFDFVVKRDEELVRSWVDVVKGWGVNERGQPSDGGFGFGKFSAYPAGRDSRFVIR